MDAKCYLGGVLLLVGCQPAQVARSSDAERSEQVCGSEFSPILAGMFGPRSLLEFHQKLKDKLLGDADSVFAMIRLSSHGAEHAVYIARGTQRPPAYHVVHSWTDDIHSDAKVLRREAPIDRALALQVAELGFSVVAQARWPSEPFVLKFNWTTYLFDMPGGGLPVQGEVTDPEPAKCSGRLARTGELLMELADAPNESRGNEVERRLREEVSHIQNLVLRQEPLSAQKRSQ